MKSNGVGLLVLSLAVFSVLFHDYRIYSHVPLLSQTAAVCTSKQPSSGDAANKQCPFPDGVKTYYDTKRACHAEYDPAKCAALRSGIKSVMAEPRESQLASAGTIAQTVQSPCAVNLANCSCGEKQQVVIVQGTCESPNTCRANATISPDGSACIYSADCSAECVPANATGKKLYDQLNQQYSGSGSPATPISTNPSLPSQPAPSAPSSPAPSAPALSSPAPAPATPSAPLPTGPLTPSSPAPQPITTIDQLVHGIQAVGSTPLPTGSAPAIPFQGIPGLSQTAPRPVTSPVPAVGGKAPTVGGIPQPQSTFGSGVPYRAPTVSNTSYLSSMSSYLSAINPISVITSGINLVTSIINTASAPSNSTNNTVVVQQPIHVMGLPSGGTPSSNTAQSPSSAQTRIPQAPPGQWLVVTPSPASSQAVGQITSLLQDGLFVDISNPTTISGLVASMRVQVGIPTPSLVAVTPRSGVILGQAGNVPKGALSNTPQNSNGTSNAEATFNNRAPSAVDIGSLLPVGTSWSLLIGSVTENANSSRDSGDSSNAPPPPLVQKQAALAQALSNYEAARAQIDILQQASTDGICDSACQDSLDTLLKELPLHRATVNALNNAIDEDIAHISHKSFASGMPLVSIQQTGIPPAAPFTSSDHLPPDLTGLALAAEIHADVLAGGANGTGNAHGGNGGEGNGASGGTPATASHDPFEKPIFVLDHPWIFTPPATGTATLNGSEATTGFQSLSGQSSIVQYVSVAWQQLTDWLGSLFVQDTSQPCSLLFSLFGLCKK